MHKIAKYWRENYPEALPLGYQLKWNYAERWLRLYSLPDGKQFADTADEYKIILARQNQLFNDIIGEGEELYLMLSLVVDTLPEEYLKYADFQQIDKFNTDADKSKEFDLFLYAASVQWERERFDQILWNIADDWLDLFFVAPSKKCIIAPYAGGTDIILDTEQRRKKLWERYILWAPRKDEID